MSKKQVKYSQIVCDSCGKNIEWDEAHYLIKVKKFSTINMAYLKPETIHLCGNHEGEKILNSLKVSHES